MAFTEEVAVSMAAAMEVVATMVGVITAARHTLATAAAFTAVDIITAGTADTTQAGGMAAITPAGVAVSGDTPAGAGVAGAGVGA